MTNVLFISDLHLGHRKIIEFTDFEHGAFRGGQNSDEHDEWVISQCLSAKPTKRTLWWILGDVAMDESKLVLLDRLPGKKRLILGNHDLFKTQSYLDHFEWIGGSIKKYDMWLSHCPMHPDELRGLPNVHGHCHYGPINNYQWSNGPDPRYLNLALDWAPGNKPISLDELRVRLKDVLPVEHPVSNVEILGDTGA